MFEPSLLFYSTLYFIDPVYILATQPVWMMRRQRTVYNTPIPVPDHSIIGMIDLLW